VNVRKGTTIIAISAFLSLALPSVRAQVISLATLGDDLLNGPVLEPTRLPFLDPNQLLDQKSRDARDIVAIEQVHAAYVFYHDAFDGERLASLFTPDGIFEDVYNNYGTLQPTFGTGGLGCVLRGRAQIAKFIADEELGNAAFPAPFPGHGHHQVTSKLVNVSGDTATLTAAYLYTSVNDATGTVSVTTTGEYITDFVRTPTGWMISHNRALVDIPGPSTVCDLQGPLPR
jgi:hypothetical protein